MSDSPDLLKPDEVTYNELQIELGNLKAENETLKADYAKPLESSGDIIDKLRGNVRELRSQLEVEKTRSENACEELDDMEKTCTELRSELSDLKQKSVTASKDLPEAADLLNQLKAKNPKTKTTYSDVDKILAILKES